MKLLKPKKNIFRPTIELPEGYQLGHIYYQLDEEYPFSKHITIDVIPKQS
jgi:hypothetical protein